jgi:hypothetical protein
MRRGLAQAGLWLSPPVLLAVSAGVMVDGTRGLWAPAVLAGAACLVAAVLAAAWARLGGDGGATVTALAGHRWPGARHSRLPLAIGAAGSALLFLWAQLAAGGELAREAGWPSWAVVALGAAVLALASVRGELAAAAGVVGGGLAVVGVLVPLAAVAGATDPVWPRVFDAVASRDRARFSGEGTWTREGWPVRGGGEAVVIAAPDEQRLTVLGRARARIELWEGGGAEREVAPGTELTLRPGDRLVLDDPVVAVRFQPGRAIPGAPASGPDWLSPAGGSADWPRLAGLGVTVLLGALGLAPLQAALPSGRRAAGGRGAKLGAALAVLGLVAATGWSLYAAWLTPEVYTGGVAGGEVYELPLHVAALGPWRVPLADLARLGLVGGAVAATVAALRALPGGPSRAGVAGTVRLAAALLVMGLAGTVARPTAWTALVAALGLAASVTAPATVLACWRERLDPRAVGGGAAIGLAAFLALALLAVAGASPGPDAAPLLRLAAWPAVGAAALNALAVVWLSPGRRASPRSPLPPELADLHA